MSDPSLSPRLLIIVGPTGVGKTQLAVSMARSGGGEVISADSMQVYRYMDIGTAKPGQEERFAVPHHLIDVVNPDEDFHASAYIQQAGQILGAAENKGKFFLVVGGAGLYIKTLLGGLISGPGADPELRAYYREQLTRLGLPHLYGLLQDKDPLAAARIEPHDVSRIIRALEVWDLSGQSIVRQQEEHHFGRQAYRYLKIGLTMARDRLYERIDARVEEMMARGFVEEVRWLLAQGYHEDLKSMQSLGYRHMVAYLSGRQTREEAVEKMKRETRQYAKRQATWFRGDREINWFDVEELPAAMKLWESFRAGESLENSLKAAGKTGNILT